MLNNLTLKVGEENLPVLIQRPLLGTVNQSQHSGRACGEWEVCRAQRPVNASALEDLSPVREEGTVVCCR